MSVPPPNRSRLGVLFASVLILITDGLVIASSNLRQIRSGGFPVDIPKISVS